MFQCTKSIKFHFRWGTKPRDQKQDTGNDCDVISGLQASRKTDLFDISYFRINNALLYHLLANWLVHNKKTTEKSVSARLGVLKWRHNRSQSPVFGHAALYPTGSEIWRFWYIKQGKGKSQSKIFFAIPINTLGRFNRPNKIKVCHIHLNSLPVKGKQSASAHAH